MDRFCSTSTQRTARQDVPRRQVGYATDTDRTVLERYGAWGEKVVKGERKLGVLRITYLIDPNGNVAAIWRDVDPTTHASTVIARL